VSAEVDIDIDIDIEQERILETIAYCSLVADGVGFEPTVSVNPRRFSRPLP
jgi:hypothetical protein